MVKNKIEAGKREINKISLAMGRSVRESVIVATSTQIKAYTSVGKEYFAFDTNLTEPIKFMAIEDNYVWVAGVKDKNP